MPWPWKLPPPAAAAAVISTPPPPLSLPVIRTLPFSSVSLSTPRPATVVGARRPLSSSCPSSSPNHPSSSALDLLLRRCSTPRQSQQVHSRAVVLSGALHGSTFVAARLVSAYSRFGLLAEARAVFLGAVDGGTTILWNSVLRAYLSHGRHGEALALYGRMRRLAVPPDGFTFPIIVRCCASAGSPALCKAVHGHAVAAGYSVHLHVGNELVLMYGSIGEMRLAHQVFEMLTVRNVVSWNTLLSGFAANHDCVGASNAFRRMESQRYEPNSVTWTSLLSAHARCGEIGAVLRLFNEMRAGGIPPTPEAVSVVLSVCTNISASDEGKTLHSFTIRNGVEGYVFVRNSLICFYGKLGNREDAELLFLRTQVRTLVTWNALISCYAAAGLYEKAYEVFLQLEAMSDIKPNLVTWSAIIGGFASGGKVEQSLELFRRMQGAGIRPNAVTVAIVLSACAEISALSLGKELHCHIIRVLRDGDVLVGNGLISMYAKCGSLRNGRLVFDMIEDKDLITWNSMISGYGVNGFVDDALSTFNDMVDAGFDPNGISFVAVLSACAYAGYVTEGRRLFDQMICKYTLSPWMEHYACMVDLLGRAGLLEDARQLLEKMPFKPNVCVWGALLNSCRIYRNAQMADEAASHVFSLELETAGSHMMLSNIYASCGRWADSASVRVLTKEKGLKKSPGQSWIELKKKVYVFSAGITLPQGMENVYVVLEELNQLIESKECFAAYDPLLPCPT